MNIITGKILTLSAALLVAGAAVAGSQVVFSDDFESEVPGRDSQNWKKVWGNQGEDAIIVSSEKSVSGEKSLLIERGSNEKNWGFAPRVPLIKETAGIITFEYCFQIDGPGNAAWVGFELRSRNNKEKHALTWYIRDLKFIMASTVPNAPDRGRIFGPTITPGVWYKMKITVPLSKEDGDNAKIEITNLGTKEIFNYEIAYNHPSVPGAFMTNFHPGKNNFKLYIDDVKITVEPK